ncbi:hypothetical protein DRW41_17230 [Neobacillus piezotolerans]|uniref:Uncharacterized protein n=1 Tax=Neobacillus piezotolerans TaxID=2259171 RepID=A0A3D8GM29_9BACI|nr:hypothetical protein [Neobacillus piezotolerans]RDU35483.1 hypothetical protein DRW41_17230 [Neobacillus piezotolerans]
MYHPVVLGGLEWLYNVYENPSESTNFLTPEGRWLWEKEQAQILQLVKGVLGEDLKTVGFSGNPEFPQKNQAIVKVTATAQLGIEVGTVETRGLKIPLINRKNHWYVDLPTFVKWYLDKE